MGDKPTELSCRYYGIHIYPALYRCQFVDNEVLLDDLLNLFGTSSDHVTSSDNVTSSDHVTVKTPLIVIPILVIIQVYTFL